MDIGRAAKCDFCAPVTTGDLQAIYRWNHDFRFFGLGRRSVARIERSEIRESLPGWRRCPGFREAKPGLRAERFCVSLLKTGNLQRTELGPTDLISPVGRRRSTRESSG